MRTPSVLALGLTLAFAAPAFAQKATPGTKAPVCSGDWGPGTEGLTLQEKAERLYARLLAGARAGVKMGDKTVKYDKNPELVVDLKSYVIGGSPAAAFSAGLGMNSPGRTIGGKDRSARDLVYTTSALYEMCDQPEATIFIAHEIGHLALGHAAQLEKKKSEIIDRLYAEWEATHTVPDGEDSNVTVKRFFKDGAPKLEKELLPVQAPLEQQADDYARELSLAVGVPVDVPAKAFLRAQDWLWALRLDMADDGHGGTVKERAEKSAKWAASQRVMLKQAEDASRRAKCAAQGMSCP